MEKKMTAEEAKKFDRYSLQNAMIVKGSLTCNCDPYKDVYTYNRWQAQGIQVQKGQHGIKLGVIQTIEEENENGEKITKTRPWHTTVFCRCQVKPKA